MSTLLGHLSTSRFTRQVEDLATEALCYILRRSSSARAAIGGHVARCGRVLPKELFYAAQAVGEKKERLDLVGRTVDGAETFIVEAKFWAGLTENQPVRYLQRLSPGGVLLFVVPELRMAACWNDLMARCGGLSPAVTVIEVAEGEMRAAQLDGGKVLALTSWRRLLADMRRSMQEGGDEQALQDVIQLQGLCDRQDQAAFLPLSDEELSSPFRRLYDFQYVLTKVWPMLSQAKVATQKGGVSQGFGFIGRGILLRGVPARLLCAFEFWVKFGMTPIWLSFITAPEEKKFEAGLLAALDDFRHRASPRLLQNKYGHWIIPIMLPVGVEEDRVVASIVDQVKEIGERIAHITVTPIATGSDDVAKPNSVGTTPGLPQPDEISSGS